MKKANNISIIAIIAILVVINIIALLKYSGCAKNSSFLYEFLRADSIQIERNKAFLHALYSYTMNRQYLQNNIQNDSLMQYLRKGETIIFYFENNACGTCIGEIMDDLNILQDKIPNNIVIIVGNVKDNGSYKIRSDYVHLKRFAIKEKPFENISILVTNSSLEIKSYYNYETYPEFKDKFIEEVLFNYFKK